jgi:endonuclease-3
MKARSLSGMARAVVDRHAGEIPQDMDALVALPGVGRKTANVVRGHAFGLPGLPVDRHVLRVANRLGLIRTDDAVAAETALCSALPPARWTRASDTLILHGRRVCKPSPLCDRCNARGLCAYFQALGAKARARGKAGPRKKPVRKGARS